MSDEALFQKRMAKRTKGKKQSKIDVRSDAEKEIDSSVADTKLQEQHRLQKKKNFHRMIYAGVAMLLAYFIYYLFKPYHAGMGYGVCKVYTELNARYPDTLYFSSVEPFASSIRVWYTQIDAFGEYKLDSIQCFYKPDPSGRLPFILERIAVNRRDVDPEKVEQFNKILPVIFAHPPDLIYPTALPDSLADLKIDPTKYLKKILE